MNRLNQFKRTKLSHQKETNKTFNKAFYKRIQLLMHVRKKANRAYVSRMGWYESTGRMDGISVQVVQITRRKLWHFNKDTGTNT